MPKRKDIYISTLKHVAECPAWVSDKESDKTAAEFGSLFHDAMEHCDFKKLETNTELVEAAGYTLTECKDAYDFGHEWLDNYVTEFQPTERHTEKKILLKLIEKNCKMDELLLKEEVAGIVDWKTGRAINGYDAKEEIQGKGYACCIFENFPLVNEVEITFVIPFSETVVQHTFKRDDYQALKQEILQIHVASCAEEPKENLCSSCNWCGRLDQCKEVQRIVETKFGEDFEMPNWDTFVGSPSEMMKARDLCGPLEALAARIKKKANAMWFKHGEDIPGYKEYHNRKRLWFNGTAFDAWLEIEGMISEGILSADDLNADDILIVSSPKLDDYLGLVTDVEKRKVLTQRLRDKGLLRGGAKGDETVKYLRAKTQKQRDKEK